eukprot:Sspe_Gene.92765::Locus_65555_Transcript_1_1_Confidence_1.000_Length_1590::g.92765::m.92765/K11412/SIRT2, SIR2L2; NAD-dependent deacetylase sirtuin 2
MDDLISAMSKLMGKGEEEEEEELPPLFSSFDVQGVVDYIKEKKVSKIVVMVGAGMSVAAGIPDFRSPGTGLYDNLQKYNLPEPSAIFTLSYLRENPKPFFYLAKELWPGTYDATYAHYFLRELDKQGLLLRVFSQNIDGLERVAGLPEDRVVYAHGSFDQAHCIDCHKEYETSFVKDAVFREELPKCTKCSGVVKPDIVFFGESLPDRFFRRAAADLPECDLLMVIGTSLMVHPFAGLVNLVRDDIPRVLVNRETAGGMNFGKYRDVFLGGDLQEQTEKLAEGLGMAEALKQHKKPPRAPSAPQGLAGPAEPAAEKAADEHQGEHPSPAASPTRPSGEGDSK